MKRKTGWVIRSRDHDGKLWYINEDGMCGPKAEAWVFPTRDRATRNVVLDTEWVEESPKRRRVAR